jgi:hypothetical protein
LIDEGSTSSTRFLFRTTSLTRTRFQEIPTGSPKRRVFEGDTRRCRIPAIVGTRGTVVALGQLEEGMSLLKKSMEGETRPSSRGEMPVTWRSLARDGRMAEAPIPGARRQLYPQCRLIERAQGKSELN